jgi:hypothetical protein
MKRFIIVFLLLFTGMILFAQNAGMSFYVDEFNRLSATFINRLEVLENVRDLNQTGLGNFYHDALKVLIMKFPDIKTPEDRDATEASVRIVCNGLAAEKYHDAGPELWQIIQYYDVVRDINDGLVMQDALIAMRQTGNKAYVHYVIQVLDDFNTQETSDVEKKRRIQRGVVGAIYALEAFHEAAGYRPVFFVYTGWYDPAIRSIAYDVLPNIVDDPGEVISAIIQDNTNLPAIKYNAWQEMLRTRAPSASKAKVAAVALAAGWSYPTSTPVYQRDLREMRKSAIDVIRVLGVQDDSVYANLERSYTNNFTSNSPDYDEIRKTLDALAAVKSDEAVQLLVKFLRELNTRRRSGPWSVTKERQIFNWVITSIGATKTQSMEARAILLTIQNSQDYTGAEQGWAAAALRELQ